MYRKGQDVRVLTYLTGRNTSTGISKLAGDPEFEHEVVFESGSSGMNGFSSPAYSERRGTPMPPTGKSMTGDGYISFALKESNP